MKKIINTVLALFLIFSFSLVDTNALNRDEIIHSISSFIYTFDNIEADVTYVRDLKDINNNYSFELYEIKELGYAVIAKTNGNIVDIQYGEMPDTDSLYYLGPTKFASELVSTRSAETNTTDITLIKNATEMILNEESVDFDFQSTIQTRGKPNPTKPSVISGGTEVGIAESRFNLFTNDVWIVRGDICGAYMGAAMVSYMDKYFGGNYIKEKYTIDSSATYGNYIIGRFKQQITGGVTTFKLINAINTVMMADYPKGGKTGTSTATESTYKSKIKAGRPMIFLLNAYAPGNSYGGHFVLAYRYVDYNGYLWFKAYDGWSGNNLKSWINRNWISNGIYLN